MFATFYPSFISALRLLSLTATLIFFASQVYAQARIISIDGAMTRYSVVGQNGQQVEVEMPSMINLSTDKDDAVNGKVVSVDHGKNQMQVHTVAGQTVLLELSPTMLANFKVGDAFTLKKAVP